MNLRILVPMIVFIWVSCVVGISLFAIYNPARTKGRLRHWAARWNVLLPTSNRTLVLISFLGLFLELILIRWVSSEIRIFAYFKNFVLIACFLGFGLGSSLCRRHVNLLPLFVPLLTVTVLMKFPSEAWRNFLFVIPSFIGAFSEVHVWGIPSIEWSWSSLGTLLSSTTLIAPIFGLLTLIFIPIGQITGRCLESAPNGAWAYSLNLLAGLAGILFYTLLCFYSQPPSVWLAASGILLTILLWEHRRAGFTILAAFLACGGLSTLNPYPGSMEYWSPYQKLRLTPQFENGELSRYDLSTNDSWYQYILNLSPSFVAAHPNLLRGVPAEWHAYNLPYGFFPRPQSVLILGAGTGNDTAAAVRNRASRVVAVEIDPLIFDLGRSFHFEQPYNDSRVQCVLQDARSYLQNSQERFDLIVFSLLDSHTNSSHFTNIRIDSYVYTREAFEAASRLLSPEGLVVVKFAVTMPWIAGRLHTLMTMTFGDEPIEFRNDTDLSNHGSFYIVGSRQTLQRALADASFGEYVKQHGNLPKSPATITTDDWPYFYQHEPGLPASVIAISIVLLLLCWLALAKTGVNVGSTDWHFFFLGAAFLLLETQIISRMALLFGTTWLVNSIVISSILLLIVAANFVAQYVTAYSFRVAYAGLFISLSVCYFVPTRMFFLDSLWLRVLASAVVFCLPVFFAGIIFVRSFSKEGFSGKALGSNLMGALLGGLLESLSLWTGLKALLIIAGFLYLASWIALRSHHSSEALELSATTA